ncbi:MAG: leucine-rich repeat domain-containing protein [Ardenticatenaceae bacterium]|nr:leucine-rich repeat domain-containing protein [Ardenticatenaceae bacterium]
MMQSKIDYIPQWALDQISYVEKKASTWLDLNGHGRSEKLTKVPEKVANLTMLNTVILSGNHLTTVPSLLNELPNLKLLNLSHNRLTVVPLWLANLPSLEKLYLHDNPIELPPPGNIESKWE